MKKLLTFIYIMMTVMAAQSQVVTLKFMGTDRTGQDYVRLHHVSVYDHDQLWHQVIYYPDTTLRLYQNGTVGIVETMCTTSLQLSQNTPNPFTGTTDVNLTTADAGAVTLEIVDGNGKIVETWCTASLPMGTNQFRVSLSAAGTYVMTARQNGKTSSIKMVCNGGGGSNSITHVGTISNDGTITLYLKNGMSNGSYPFCRGDRMEYTGYAVIDDIERVSETITCNQGGNSDFRTKFDVARPEVTTLSATNITAYNATLHGEVTADNNALVTERGFCWVMGTGTPTLADNHVAVGDGVGTFDVETMCISSLQPGKHYRVRAYAVNAVGVSYGTARGFDANDTLPEVTTTQPTNVASTAFTCGGNVVAINSATLADRGVCWNTTGNPTVADSHTTDGNTVGSFTSSVTGLEPATQYFVRAYAKNAVGTAYGETYTVTTLNDIPIVVTAEVSDIVARTAQCGGEVVNEHGASVTERGICWNTTGNPTITDSYTTDGNGLGEFASTLNELTPNTQYYVRAYATNSVGTVYGEVRSFTTLCDLPEVTTTQPTDVTTTSYNCGGNVIAINCDGLTARGVCWNTTGNPTVADSHTTDGTTAGSFTSSVTGLVCATTYHVRAYATNSVGTNYGEEYVVTTLASTTPDVATLSAILYNGLSMIAISEVTSENCEAISSRGICYSTSPNPTISDSHTTHAIGLGTINDTITEFDMGITYYVRAYATNSVGTAYGEELSVTTPTLPVVTTATVTNIRSTTATCGGNVTDDGGATVTARGVCWSTSPNPTTGDAHTTNGIGTGSFTSSITGLTDGTTYYVRAYATNVVGTVYGEERSFTTLKLPTVTTTPVTHITVTTATCGGNVTSDGGATVIARGVCWSTSHNPTTSGSHTTHGLGTGSFTSSITGLTSGTTYYVRAYATNSEGTSYGNEVNFTTTAQDGDPCPGTPTLTDASGNTYNTVWIGSQCWMRENLRTTKYADNTPIAQGSETSTTTAYWYYPNDDASNKPTYGLLYNWKAVMGDDTSSSANPSGVQGICPIGWHVPSDAEWKQMEMAVGMNQSDADNTGYRGNIAARLYGNTGWTSSSTANAAGNTSAAGRNSSGFSVLPAGYYIGNYNNFGNYASFWSATENSNSSTHAWQRYLDYNNAGVRRGYNGKEYGYSVRCVRDESQGGGMETTIPTVTTAAVSDITATTATCGGNVTSDGGATVIARGVCCSTSHNPTTGDAHTTNGTGTGSFTSSITGLTAGTTYYVRAYATNSEGTSYGNEVNFTTTSGSIFTCGTSTLTDIEGNTYNTVQIGTQCWMKENLRTTKYAANTPIEQGSETSTTTAYWYYPNNSSSNMSTYGLLYNWKAVMGSSSSSSANPSGVQGICPNDWHVPSDAEWTQLTNYVKSQSQYVCGSGSSNIAKALAATTGWNSNTTTCAVGNTPSSNNATGFSALPAGEYDVSYYKFGVRAYFWSATEYNSTYAYYRDLLYAYEGVLLGYTTKYSGYSVRCVKD